MNSIKSQIKFEHYAGRIEVTHFEESMIFVTFSALQGHKPSVSALDPQLQGLGEDPQFQGPLQEVYLLDSETDDLAGKLELYIKKAAPFFYERELSDFMKPTLMLAAELGEQKKVSLLRSFRYGDSNLLGSFGGASTGVVGSNSYSCGLRAALENVLQSHCAPDVAAHPRAVH